MIRKKLHRVCIGAFAFVTMTYTAQAQFTEGFDNIGNLTAGGWQMINLSNPTGVNSWFQGVSFVFNAQSGADSSYIASNYDCTDSGGTISLWLMTPEVQLANGFQFSFYTRTVDSSASPDRLQLRYSSNGASTNAGANESSVGDFTTLMLDINDSLQVDSFPTSWRKYAVTLSGIATPVNGRFAFRYYVTNAGPFAANSNFIGIDSVSYSGPMVGINSISVSDPFEIIALPDYLLVQQGRNDFSEAQINFFNVEGQLIYSSEINSNHAEISTAKFPPGIYFLNCLNKSGRFVKKVFID